MSQKSLDLAGLRVGLALVIAQKKHERLSDSIAHDAAKGSPVHIDASLASGIVVAELQGCGTTERVAEHPTRCISSRPRNLPEGSDAFSRSS
jgi:hypothetical protein